MGSRLEQKSTLIRKRIEGHTFDGEEGEEYEGSKFGGFSEYFRRKKIKLQNLDAELRAQSSDFPQIFKGIVCHVNGYTQPSLNDIHTMIVQHGGGFIQYLDGKTMVTHIIASNLTPKKKEEFKRYRIVKPAWIVDSVKAGTLLPWDRYRVIDEGVAQKVLGFENGQIVSQANKKAHGYKEQTDSSWYTSQLRSDTTRHALHGAQSLLTNEPTIGDEIQDNDDDEYSLADITSSMERALADVESEANTGTTRPSDPNNDLHAAGCRPTSTQNAAKSQQENHFGLAISDIPTKEAVDNDVSEPTLRSREGSQEPDVSHAVIRDSEVLRAISPTRLANMTAEEHNALLLSDPKIRKSTVVHPDFLEQYYRESRLHHLSTWKADLKSQLQALAAEKSNSQKPKQKRLPGQRRYIMHVDFDSFFAAVSLIKHPEYKDKPVVVAHGGGSGSEIASCNYPARAFGISNGMWMRRAQTLCADLKVLPYDFPAYEDASRKFYDAILSIGGIVQSVSIDECLVDISALCFAASGQTGVSRAEGSVDREQSEADKIAQALRDEVFRKTGCAVSVGIGGNILQAKVALRKAKPAGQYQLKPDEAMSFIGQLEVQRLPGVAWSIGGKLEEIGVKLVKDIWDVSRERLINTLGPKTGEKIWEYARGIDKTEVGEQVVRKSVSAEVNWGVRFENQEQVDEFMEGLSGELHKRLVKERVKGKQLTMKVMRRAADAPRDPPKHLGHGKCDVFNKSLQLGVATNDTNVICKEAIAIMKSFCISPGELRGIGIQMQKLEPMKQGSDGTDQASQRKLHFKPGQPSKRTAQVDAASDPILDERVSADSIPDVNRPSAAYKPVTPGTPTKSRLNVLGTQFILPSQVDASVLAELPADIRAKLTRHSETVPVSKGSDSESLAAETDSRVLKTSKVSKYELPSHSQIDPTILDALPEDLRREILGFYDAPVKRGEQTVLPQSPRKNRILPPTRAAAKRGGKRGGTLFSSRSRLADHDNNTLTQSNFVARPLPKHRSDSNDETRHEVESESGELDPEVLAALPADLRQEVLDQQRQLRLQKAGGIDLSLHQRSKAARRRNLVADDSAAGPLDRHFVLPPRSAVPTFTSRKLHEPSDLRAAITAWVCEFSFSSDDEEQHEGETEGPYEEDIAALSRYLTDVVLKERNLAKAVAMVQWLIWTIDDQLDSEAGRSLSLPLRQELRSNWLSAADTIRTSVQAAATERGLGDLDFE